jgi:predicted Rossmann fold flavoprotein
MLTGMAARAGAEIWLKTSIGPVTRTATGFAVPLTRDGRHVTVTARNLVVATGGKSIPKMGATGLAYDIAARFGLPVTETRPALVPMTFAGEPFASLAGVALPVTATAGNGRFAEAMLFTHRGLSGPAILQASSYWREGAPLVVDLAPGIDLAASLRAARKAEGKRALSTLLARHLPARLVDHLAPGLALGATIGAQSDAQLATLDRTLHDWTLRPTATEGYRTAEVTLGGIDTDALNARTMEAKSVPGLHFIGECVDVTGWLGGYNFQWAWASAHACGTAIAQSA